MKTNYKLIALFVGLLLPFMMQAQRQVFFAESMGEASSASPSPTVLEWTAWQNTSLTITSGDIANQPDVRATVVSAAAVLPYPEASGSNNVYFAADTVILAGDVKTGLERGFAMGGIDASAFKNIQLSFGYRKTLAEVSSDLDVYYSTGSNWVKLDFQFNEVTNPAGWYRSPVISLPEEASVNGLAIRFVRPASSMNSIRLDDVWLTGEPKITASPVVNEASNVNSSSFTVSWDAYPNATGYLLDVSENANFTAATDTTILAAWTFPVAYVKETLAMPNTYTSNNEEMILTTTATGNATDPIPYSVGSGTVANPYAYSSTGWEDGVYKKHFQIDVNTVGFYGLTLSSWHYSSGNGPKNMKVQYRVGTSKEWIDVPNSDLVMPNAAYGPTSKLSNLPLPSAFDNQEEVSIRWTMTGSMRTSGASAYIVTSGGTSRITNIFVKGMAANAVAGYQSIPVTGTSKDVTGLEVDKTYYFRVRATDGKYVSNASEIKQATTVLSTVQPTIGAEDVQIYYNQLTASFDIKSSLDLTNIAVKVSDLSGRTLIQARLNGSERSVRASELSSGVYVVTLSYNGQAFNYKIVK